MTTLAIVQSCYIPWKGYFDLIRRADSFVLYDCVQYTTRDWRNRNRIKTPHGLHWLTIPVKHVSQKQTIAETQLLDEGWREQHWKSLQHHYAKAPYFTHYASEIEKLYEHANGELLSDINAHFLKGIMTLLGIHTPIILLKEGTNDTQSATQKLLSICREFSATRYLSGPSAKTYLDTDAFSASQIQVEWMDYSAYLEYNQLNPPFEHGVSMLDMLFNVGDNWQDYLA